MRVYMSVHVIMIEREKGRLEEIKLERDLKNKVI